MPKSPADTFLESVRFAMPCCPNCEHFSTSIALASKDEYCGLDPQKRRPPARTIAFGCPRFVQDIPF